MPEVRVVQSMQAFDDNGLETFPKVGSRQVTITQTNPGGGVPGKILPVSTGQGTQIPLTGLVAAGLCWIKNVHATIDVDFGTEVAGTFHPCITIKAGEQSGPFRLKAGVQHNLKAASGTGDCQVFVLNN